MSKIVKVSDKIIGDGYPCFIIAEIGINHNGSVNLAKKMIDIAVTTGCDAVKFQKRTVDVVYTKEELAKERPSVFGNTNGDLKRGLEFGYDEYKQIDEYCKEKGIILLEIPNSFAKSYETIKELILLSCGQQIEQLELF